MSKIFFIAYNNIGAAGDCQEKEKEIEGGRGECICSTGPRHPN